VSALLQHLAHDLAEKQAVNTILDACAVEVVDGVLWRNTNVLSCCTSVVWEVKYLHMRGLLCHHPLVHNLVRLRRDDEKTVQPSNP